MPTDHELQTTNIRLGLSSYTYGWAVGVRSHEPACPLDENGLLDKCREHGVRVLQIGDNLPLHTFDAARLDRLAQRAKNERVQLEIGARRLTVEHVAKYATIARQLGARLIRFVTDDTDYHPQPDDVSGVLRKAVSLLDGLTLGIENHDRFPAATLRSMIEAVGSDRIGVCLDTANSLGAGEGLETVLGYLAPLTVNLHIKDFHIARVPHLMGFAIEGRPAGQGLLDIPTLLKRLTPVARCQTAVLELWTPPESTLEDTIAREAAWAGQSLDFLKPLFA
jgi:sugar phosphate isomerase/epimerase